MVKYTMYVGLNDKDLKKQVITTSDAKKIVVNALNKAGIDGLTLSEAVGIWNCEEEKSLRAEILFTTREKIMSAIQTIKGALNQEAIALQVEEIASELI